MTKAGVVELQCRSRGRGRRTQAGRGGSSLAAERVLSFESCCSSLCTWLGGLFCCAVASLPSCLRTEESAGLVAKSTARTLRRCGSLRLGLREPQSPFCAVRCTQPLIRVRFQITCPGRLAFLADSCLSTTGRTSYPS